MAAGSLSLQRRFRERYKYNKENGICTDCKNPEKELEKGSFKCKGCNDKRKIISKNRREKCKYSRQSGSTEVGSPEVLLSNLISG